MRKFWQWYLAYFRLSNRAICEQSAGLGLADYHDYPDSKDGQPWHLHVLTCDRCGKQFMI